MTFTTLPTHVTAMASAGASVVMVSTPFATVPVTAAAAGRAIATMATRPTTAPSAGSATFRRAIDAASSGYFILLRGENLAAGSGRRRAPARLRMNSFDLPLAPPAPGAA